VAAERKPRAPAPLARRGSANLDPDTVAGFGAEWSAFDQRGLGHGELEALFERYFAIFPWEALPEGAVGFDMGCGSGRWASLVAPRVGRLHCIDASPEALAVARHNLRALANCEFAVAGFEDLPLPEASMDFGYCLGVLHHVPDPGAALAACVARLKPGAPLLVYLYYAFDNRPAWFRALWRASDLLRRGLSRLPFPARRAASELLALAVYWPLARLAAGLERAGLAVDAFPLSAYRHSSLYVMRNDALDRFGTRLERRFTRAEIERMMGDAGLTAIRFSAQIPYWCAVGRRAAPGAEAETGRGGVRGRERAARGAAR